MVTTAVVPFGRREVKVITCWARVAQIQDFRCPCGRLSFSPVVGWVERHTVRRLCLLNLHVEP